MASGMEEVAGSPPWGQGCPVSRWCGCPGFPGGPGGCGWSGARRNSR